MPSSSMWLMQISSPRRHGIAALRGAHQDSFQLLDRNRALRVREFLQRGPKALQFGLHNVLWPCCGRHVGFTHDPLDKAQVLAMSISISVWMQHSRNAMEELGWIDTYARQEPAST